MLMADYSVNRIVQATAEKQIEKRTLRENAADPTAALGKSDARARRERIVRRAAKELKDGAYVNLGIVSLPGSVQFARY
jgi:3-oxoacid CoA-transferase